MRPRSEAVSGKGAFRPASLAQIALGLRQPAHRGERQRHRDVGDVLVEHAGRMGDDDRRARRPRRRRYGRSRRRSWRRSPDSAGGASAPRRSVAVGQVETMARMRGAIAASVASRSGARHSRCSVTRSSIRSAIPAMPSARHQNFERRHASASPRLDPRRIRQDARSDKPARRAAPSPFAPPPDVAHPRPCRARPNSPLARRRPMVRRLMLSDFRSYASARPRARGRADRVLRRKRRGQDQSSRSPVAVRAGTRPAGAPTSRPARASAGPAASRFRSRSRTRASRASSARGWSRAARTARPSASIASIGRRSPRRAPSPITCAWSG